MEMGPSYGVIGLRYCHAKSGGLHFGLAFSAGSFTFFQDKVKEKIDFSTFYIQQKLLHADKYQN